ncbi:MAG: hypothetical protein JSS67_02640 [Bacteroidetes bacterium]|nr:hypothetical protein [Bacteroidota bacterium]
MKKYLFSIALFAGVAVQAQSDKFMPAMKENLTLMDSSKTTEDFQKVSAAFERIGDAEKTQWLPYYYAGLALTTPAWYDTQIDKDANAQKILAFCDKADALATANEDKAEILAVRNMALTQQMLVDPQSRYMTYGQEAAADLQKGMQLDPNNPRLVYLQAMSIYGTPAQFGGGPDKAKPELEKALEMFKSFQAKPLHPDWGMKQTENVLSQIK